MLSESINGQLAKRESKMLSSISTVHRETILEISLVLVTFLCREHKFCFINTNIVVGKETQNTTFRED